MRYTTFGRRTGLRVSEYALGTGNFGTGWGSGAERDEALRMFDRFAEAGGTFIDTADVYQFGQAESLLGEFLAGRRDHFTVASKFGQGVQRGGGVNETGNSRKTLTRALEATLKRLRTDYLDLYWVHFPDFVTPVDEIVATFDQLIAAGKILHGGLSNFPAWRVARAATLAELSRAGGAGTLIGVQAEYSLAVRDAERELLPMAEGLGLGFAGWSPLGGGLLTGKYRHSDEGRLTTLKSVIQREDSARKTAALDAVLAVAKETGAPPSQVAMAWLRERGRRFAGALIPIIGPRTPQQLEDYLAALDLELTAEQYDQLSHASAADLGILHEAAARNANVELGGQADRFDRLAPVV
jgi:aryl-alcohol dehydrogenase-like predicted oxidoreductase